MNELDMRKIERGEKLMRNNFPEKVLGALAQYPEEGIIFEQDWKNLWNYFLVTNEKMIFYKIDLTDHLVLPFEDFGGSSIGQERNFLTGLGYVRARFVTLRLSNLKDNLWLRLPWIFPPGTDYSTPTTAIDNAYNLRLI